MPSPLRACAGSVDDVRLVALDIDGTLAGADHLVSDYSYAVLRRLAAAGIASVIITGRTESAALAIADAAAVTAPVISCNGAMVTDPANRTRLRVTTLDGGFVRDAVSFGVGLGLQPVLWTADEMITDRPSPGTATLADINVQQVRVADLAQVSVTGVVKMMFTGAPHELDAAHEQLTKRFPQFLRSMDMFYETAAPGASKADALAEVRQLLKIPASACMGFGDGDTDRDWLASVGISVVPANARPGLLDVAHLQIGHHAHDAVAHYLEDTFLGT